MVRDLIAFALPGVASIAAAPARGQDDSFAELVTRTTAARSLRADLFTTGAC